MAEYMKYPSKWRHIHNKLLWSDFHKEGLESLILEKLGKKF
jgi:hypothetical protein